MSKLFKFPPERKYKLTYHISVYYKHVYVIINFNYKQYKIMQSCLLKNIIN